jgi:hypothetical protein
MTLEYELFDADDLDKDKRALMNAPKRFPGKDDEGQPFNPIKAARIPLFIFDKPEEINETVVIESDDDIV